MYAVISTIALLFGLLNAFGGVVGGIWLAALGDWHVIGIGLLMAICAPLPLGLALLPGGLLFGSLAAKLLEKDHSFIALPFAFLGQLSIHVIVTAWFFFVLWYFSSALNQHNIWPMLLWVYSTAVTPWSYMAQKEVQAGGGEGEAMTLFFSQLALAAMLVSQIIDVPDQRLPYIIFAGVMVFSAALQTILAVMTVAGSRRPRPPQSSWYTHELRP